MTSIAPIHLNYSKQLIKKSAQVYWRKYIAPLSIGILITLIIMLAVDSIIHDAETGYAFSLSVILLISATMAAASYFMLLKQALAPLKQMKKSEATLELFDDCFKIKADISSSEFKWALIAKIIRLEKAWIVCFSKYAIILLPISNMPPEAKEFILSKTKKYNAEII